jgi:peptide/nickel transport system ATP-binding protein
VADVLMRPVHPYTQGLLASTVHGQRRDLDIDAIPGSPPDMRRLAPGCSFAPRCTVALAECRSTVPLPFHPTPNRMVRCLRVGDVGMARQGLSELVIRAHPVG